MNTIQAIQAKGATLAQDLATIQAEIKTNRRKLETIAGNENQIEAAERIAARLMVLEAREKSTTAAIEANQREQQARAALMASKEYKQAQKRITELREYFAMEAGDIAQAFADLLERLGDDMRKHDEFSELVRRYCLDMDTAAQRSLTRGKDYAYLQGLYILFTQRRELEKRLEFADAESARHAEARRNPKPKAAGVIETVTRKFYRHTNHDGTPVLDAAGKPVG